MRTHVVFCIGIACVAACGGGGGGDDEVGPDAAVSATCLEATSHSDLDFIETKVFNSCRFMACHAAEGGQANNLSLEPGRSHDELVNHAAVSDPGMMLVSPGNPQDSYLLVAVGHIPGQLPESGQMPVNSPQLCLEKREAIERWIAAGALP
jgi:hypothetical protein